MRPVGRNSIGRSSINSEKGLFTFYKQEEERELIAMNAQEKLMRKARNLRNKKSSRKKEPDGPGTKRSKNQKNKTEGSESKRSKKSKAKFKTLPTESEQAAEEGGAREKFLKNILHRKLLGSQLGNQSPQMAPIRQQIAAFTHQACQIRQSIAQIRKSKQISKISLIMPKTPFKDRFSTQPAEAKRYNEPHDEEVQIFKPYRHLKRASSVRNQAFTCNLIEDFIRVKSNFYGSKSTEAKEGSSPVKSVAIKLPQIKSTKFSKALNSIMELANSEAAPLHRYELYRSKRVSAKKSFQGKSLPKNNQSLLNSLALKQHRVLEQRKLAEIDLSRAEESMVRPGWDQRKKQALKKLGLKLKD